MGNYCSHEFVGRGSVLRGNATELSKSRTDCVGTQSKECLALVRNVVKVPHATSVVSNAANQKQKHGQSVKTNVLRRKVIVSKPKTPVRVDPAALKQQSQVINRARGTLHGLSTIKRHGNVRVTPNTDYLAV